MVITLKHVNLPRTQKLWGIAHENGHKTRKRRVFGHVLKHVSVLNVIVNFPSMPNLWAIIHENGHKMQKQRVFATPVKHVKRRGIPKI